VTPSVETVDRVLEKLRTQARSVAMQGGNDSCYQSLIVAIEWATGRPSTAEWKPLYIDIPIREAIHETQ
jgi:hypothetical protein